MRTSFAPQLWSSFAASARSVRPVRISASAASVFRYSIQGRYYRFSAQSWKAMVLSGSTCRSRHWTSTATLPCFAASAKSGPPKSP